MRYQKMKGATQHGSRPSQHGVYGAHPSRGPEEQLKSKNSKLNKTEPRSCLPIGVGVVSAAVNRS
jgi:hypothetical protein